MEKKFVCGIFADIKGAFDNAWHVAIVRQLWLWGCSDGLTRIIESYLRERKVKLKVGGAELERRVSKGCPQGSVLGPILWNILFNSLLEVDMGDAEVIANADDAVVVVQGGTRREMEERLEEVAELLWRWTDGVKLELSLKKTVVMKLAERKVNVGKAQKRGYDKRKMVVRVRGRRLETVREVKYLGEWIQEGMRGDKHVVEMGSKVGKLMGAFAREMKVGRGLIFRTAEIVQKSSGAWVDVWSGVLGSGGDEEGSVEKKMVCGAEEGIVEDDWGIQDGVC